jgi:hypothetical protein
MRRFSRRRAYVVIKRWPGRPPRARTDDLAGSLGPSCIRAYAGNATEYRITSDRGAAQESSECFGPGSLTLQKMPVLAMAPEQTRHMFRSRTKVASEPIWYKATEGMQ